MRAYLGEEETAVGFNKVNEQASAAQPAADYADGIFVCGRQHSGNTLLTTLLGEVDGVVAMAMSEEVFLECRAKVDRMPDAVVAPSGWAGIFICSNRKSKSRSRAT